MSSHKTIVLDEPHHALPLEIKLNRKDGYVRLSGPMYEVYQLHHRAALPRHTTISNLYGVPMFTLVANGNGEFSTLIKGFGALRLLFSGQSLTVWNSGEQGAEPLVFSSKDLGDDMDNADLEMVAAATAACLMSETRVRRPLQTSRRAVA